MTAINLTPAGKAHMILARLEEGPATVGEIRADLIPDGSPNLARKQWYVLRAITEAGFIDFEHGHYWITEAGRVELERLRAEVRAMPGQVGARVFVRAGVGA